jgi:uncharacterized protein
MSGKKLWNHLCLVTLLCACSAPIQKGGQVDVDFLWVRTSEEGRVHEGGASHALLKVEPSESGMSVGIFETKPGGTGEMWRSALWVAALTGTLNAQKNPLEYRYSVETETLSGRVDGPSAGGLFAVAIMAALEGQKLSPTATMTGTINPDGTIGPVGGVAAKLKAAIGMGKTRFCYPAGQSLDENEVSGESFNIPEIAAKANVEAIEVEDLAQAYHCLVDRKRASVEPVRRMRMAPSGDLFVRLKEKAERWLTRTEETYQAAGKLASRERFDGFWQEARSEYEDARALLKEGLVAAAYWKAVSAYVNSRSVLLASAMVDQLADGDPVEAINVFTTVETSAKARLDEVFDALAQVTPESVNRTILMLDAYEAAITALVSREFARAQYGDILRRMKESLDKGKDVKQLVGLFAELYQPLSELALVEVNAELSMDNLELLLADEGSRATRLARIEDVARLFQGAATANIEYFDAIFVREVAEKAKKPRKVVAAALLDKEPNYRTAQFNLKLPESGKMGYAASGLPASLARLAGALSSYFASSALVARFYSIGVKFDEDGNTVGVERERALIATLALAEEKARKNAALAEAQAGAIPPSARIEYQIGMVLRDRATYREKIEALEHFWRSSVWSQVAVYLAQLEKEEEK